MPYAAPFTGGCCCTRMEPRPICPELIAVMEPLAQDPTDASARLRLYELRDLLQEDA